MVGAATIGSSKTVTAAVTTADYFASATATYYWDNNDTFQYQGVGITQAQFESMISAGDVLAVSCNPDAAGVSVFSVTTDAAPTAARAPTAGVVNADGDLTANDVRVTYTRPAANACRG